MSSTISPEALRTLAQNPPSEPLERRTLHDAARALTRSVEGPRDTETRIFTGFTTLPVVQIGADLDLFATLAYESSKVWHVSELAEKTGAEGVLLHRLLRVLASQDFIEEVDAGKFKANHITPALVPAGLVATVKHGSMFVVPPTNALPGWFKANGYRNPSGSTDCAFQAALGTEHGVMEYLAAHPEKAAATFETMAWQQAHSATWLDGAFNADEFWLTDGEVEDGRVLLVDVGGGKGHQCEAFRKAFPERKGRLVVQDMEVMINMIDHAAAKAIDLEPMVHDFFTPQPIKGAKVYYLRTVLHDWTDDKCIAILQQLREAMSVDSLLVLDEIVVPSKGAGEHLVLYDLTMMVSLGARERSEEEWRKLLGAAGLQMKRLEIYDEELQNGIVVAVPV